MRIVFVLFLTLSAAFSRVGESDAELRKRCGGAPDEVGRFENGAVRYSFGSVRGHPRVKAFVVKGTVSRVEYHGVSFAAAQLILKAQASDWAGYKGARRDWWVSESGIKAELTHGILTVSDGRFEAIMAASDEDRAPAITVPL